jgi:hypothetical protein
MKTLLALAALGLGMGVFATADTAQAGHFSSRFNQHGHHHGQFGQRSFYRGQCGGRGFGNYGYGNGFGNRSFGNVYGSGFGNRSFGNSGYRPGRWSQNYPNYRGQGSGFHMSFNLFR